MSDSVPCAADPGAFYRVEQDAEDGGRRVFLVHAGAPRVVVEMQPEPADETGPRRAHIRRVCVPNSWAGDYHLCARIIDAAIAAYEAPRPTGRRGRV